MKLSEGLGKPKFSTLTKMSSSNSQHYTAKTIPGTSNCCTDPNYIVPQLYYSGTTKVCTLFRAIGNSMNKGDNSTNLAPRRTQSEVELEHLRQRDNHKADESDGEFYTAIGRDGRRLFNVKAL